MAPVKALVVDDSKLARVTLRKLLEGRGLQVDMVDSGEQAIARLESERPHIVFMDHQMPAMDGLEAMHIIKSRPGTSDIPVVMCTGQDEPEFRSTALDMGASAILAKPPVLQELDRILEETAVEEERADGQEPMEEMRDSLEPVPGGVTPQMLEHLAMRLQNYERRLDTMGHSDPLGPDQIENMIEEHLEGLRSSLHRQIEDIANPLRVELASLANEARSASPDPEAMIEAAVSRIGGTLDERIGQAVVGLKGELHAEFDVIVQNALRHMPAPPVELSDGELERVRAVAIAAAADATEKAMRETPPPQAVEISDELHSALRSMAREEGGDAARATAAQEARTRMDEWTSSLNETYRLEQQDREALTGQIQTLDARLRAMSGRITLAYAAAGLAGVVAITVSFFV